MRRTLLSTFGSRIPGGRQQVDLGVLADGLYFLWVLDKVPKKLKSVNIYTHVTITSMAVITIDDT